MEALTTHPQNADQLKAIKSVLKILKIPFERLPDESTYDPAFVKKIQESQKQAIEGKTKSVNSERELNELLDSL